VRATNPNFVNPRRFCTALRSSTHGTAVAVSADRVSRRTGVFRNSPAQSAGKEQESIAMTRFSRLSMSFAVIGAALVIFASRVEAAKPPSSGSYSCKGDKQLDVPMQFTATIESAGRVHVSAFGGSDKSAYVEPYIVGAWRVYDSLGNQVTFFTDNLLFNSIDMLKETYLEGLLPGAYSIQLTSMDLCGNLGYRRQPITIPQLTPEANPPVISAPTIVQTGALGAYGYCLYFTATDDTGIRHIAVYVNGSLIAERDYFNGASFRWWTAFYPKDSILYPFEGPSFTLTYPDSYKGQPSVVQVVAEDLFGNQFTATAQLMLP
jgi:hypothetical protein